MDAGHTVPVIENYEIVRKEGRSAEERRAVSRMPTPHWVVSKHNPPVPHKTVHIEGELTVRECRALMRGIKHQLTRRADITLVHEKKQGYIKTTIE